MTRSVYSHKALKDKQRTLRDAFHPHLGLRVHRSLSWLNRAEKDRDDSDSAFIFLWIAFNAAYAEDIPQIHTSSERGMFGEFLERILSFDSEGMIYKAIWQKFSGPVRLIMNNPYIYQPFWHHHNGIDGYEDWEQRFDRSKSRMHDAIMKKDTKIVLSTLFDRLYVLRNQLVHGGATWNSKVNRAQVEDGAEILGALLPIFLDLMMDNPQIKWPAPNYPVVE
jgi:hypothetical protein